MKTILFLIGLFIININILVGQPSKEYTNEELLEYSKTTIQKIRDNRFLNIPNYSYREDTDLEVVGEYYLNQSKTSIKKYQKKNKIKENRQKQQNSKFKSTYLDFTIIQEENIS